MMLLVSAMSKAPASVYHRLSQLLWALIVGAVVLLAVYVSVGRLLMGMVGANQQWLLQTLNDRVPFVIERGELTAEWHGFGPELVFRDLHLTFADGEAVTLGRGRVAIDAWGSALQQSLRIKHLRLSELLLSGEVTSRGEFRLLGLGGGGGDAAARLRALLLDSERVTLEDNTLHLQSPSAEQEVLQLDVSLQRDGSHRQLRATLDTVDGSRIHFLAEGVGDPLTMADYNGVVYIDAELANLASLDRWRSLWGRRLPLHVSGKARVEGWVDWNDGLAGVQLRVTGENMLLRGESGEWALPLDSVSLESSLEQQGQRLSVFVSDLVLEHRDSRVTLPRLQVDVWGDSLRLRGQSLPVAATASLLQASNALPAGLSTALEDLRPQGELREWQFAIEDFIAGAQDWDLALGFADVALASWRGAPGVSGASGYLHLGPGRGQVTLDSDAVTLSFPTVYREALAYQALFGSLNLGWTPEGLQLDSGLLTAVGDEGSAHATLGLWIPFKSTPHGIEMDLRVGLRDVDAAYRSRYLPYLLNENLLAWLDVGVQQATLEAGGFLWRGSLRREAAAARTVQLFFVARDAQIAYHPRWPVLSVPAATVLIDDRRVSVWADSAQLYATDVSGLSAEAWLAEPGAMRLAVAAKATGSAADGMRLLNESPLNDGLQDTLQQWAAQGQLAVDLALELPLGASSTPAQVGVDITLSDGALAIRPGGLDVEGLSGQLRFDSVTGFALEDATARLWGRDLQVNILPRPTSLAADAQAPVELVMAGDVAIKALRGWLGETVVPAQVSGETAVVAKLTLAPGAAPELELRSTLRGVTLALPDIWGKPASSSLGFVLQTTLGRGPLTIDARAGSRWQARLGLNAGRVSAASLGLQDSHLPLVPGRFRVSGHAASLDLDAWQETLQPMLAASAVSAAPNSLQISVHDLLVDSLMFAGQDWQDTVIDLNQSATGWRAEAETSWLRAVGTAPADLSTLGLAVDWLDVSGLGGGGGEDPDLDAVSGWPDVDVSIAQLLRGGRPLGDLAFAVRPGERQLQVNAVRGSLAGMDVAAEPAGTLNWSDAGTRVQLDLLAEDLGDTLAALGYEAILETEQGRFGVDLQWPGAPQQFSLAAGRGVLSVGVQKGRFLSASAGTSGALRVVSILNLADIVQRLSLTQWFESGIPFDNMTGELRLEQGDIRVPQLAVAGAGSSFRFSGRSDFASRQLDGELVATLPVANNLPWVAALAGGLPVAAGVFVVSKLFEKQVSQLSSAVYAISGTWQEPVVRLDRIFDTSNVVAPEPQPAPLTRPAEAVSQDASSVPSASSEGVSSTEAESSSRK